MQDDLELDKIKQRKEEDRQYNVALAVTRLRNNSDFILLLEDMQMHRPAQLTNSLAGIVKRGESTDTVMEELKALSFFQFYTNQLVANGNSLRESLSQEDE